MNIPEGWPTQEMCRGLIDFCNVHLDLSPNTWEAKQMILSALASAPTPPAQEASLPPDVINALRFYANGEHFTIDSDAQEFDTVSGEPVNWLWSQRDEDCTAIEDGSIARAVLQGKKIHGDAESQPVEGEVFHSTPAPEVEPVAMILHCPACGTRHIDEGEWATRLHRSHECQSCRHVWRPADVATVGVAAIKTKGKSDSEPAPEVEPLVSEELRIRIRDAIAKHLGDAMFCTRVWSAWSVGTMDQHDFVTVVDDESVLMDAVDDVLKEISPDNDGLRKAADHAEGFLFAVSLMPQLGPKVREVALKHHEALRAELNKDKSC